MIKLFLWLYCSIIILSQMVNATNLIIVKGIYIVKMFLFFNSININNKYTEVLK